MASVSIEPLELSRGLVATNAGGEGRRRLHTTVDQFAGGYALTASSPTRLLLGRLLENGRAGMQTTPLRGLRTRDEWGCTPSKVKD